MPGFSKRLLTAALALIPAAMPALIVSAAHSETFAAPLVLSAPMAAGQGTFVDAQLASGRTFIAQEIAASQQTLVSLMADNVSAPASWMLAPQPGTVQNRLADYAETLRLAFEGYGDLLRLRHNRISVDLDERAADMTFAFLTTGFVMPTPNIVPIGQLPAPMLALPSLAAPFPGLGPLPGGFFSSASHQP